MDKLTDLSELVDKHYIDENTYNIYSDIWKRKIPLDQSIFSTSNLYNNRVSQNSRINLYNIKKLKMVNKVSTNMPVSAEPLIKDQRIYFTDWEGYAYAVNEVDGKIIWKKKVDSPPNTNTCEPLVPGICAPYTYQGIASTGVIYKDTWFVASVGGKIGKPYENGKPGKLYALDLTNGQIRWSVDVTDYEYGGVVAKLLAFDDFIYVGVSSVDGPALSIAKRLKKKFTPMGKGQLLAIHSDTGKIIFKKNMIGLTNKDDEGVGASIWSSMALDPFHQTLYFCTSNNYIDPITSSAKALIALDSKTGDFKWQQHINKGKISEIASEDFGSGPQLFKIHCDAIGVGGKDGYYYVFNRQNGDLIWSKKIYTGTESGSGVHGDAAIIDSTIYVWSNNGWSDTKPVDPSEYPITIQALNAYNGDLIWESNRVGANANSSGIVSNDLYIVGDLSGQIFAFNRSNGDVVWMIKLFNTTITSSITINEESLLVGCGMPTCIGGNPNNPGLYLFKLCRR